VLRSALGFGASGVVLPTRRGADPVSPVVQRVAMGAVEVLPIVRESLFVAISELKRAAVPIVGADMGGEPVGSADLRGAVALVMGEEGSGLSPKLREKCDRVVSIPLLGDLESLNVSVAAGILMYEKRRQDQP
jgi:23S rRNA (guanosine2251-2'-O)-methyltransferase